MSWRTAGILWLLAGLSSAVLAPLMTDQVLFAAYAIGAVVGILLAVDCFVVRGRRLARWGAALGVVWLVAYSAIVLVNLSGPVEYLVLPIVAAVLGAAAGYGSYRLGSTSARSAKHADVV